MVTCRILVVMFVYVKFIDSNKTTYDNMTVVPESLEKKFQHKKYWVSKASYLSL